MDKLFLLTATVTVLLTASFVEIAATVKTVRITWSMLKREPKPSRLDYKVSRMPRLLILKLFRLVWIETHMLSNPKLAKINP